eukprot:TRINITY_DN2536_c0_g1_i1.p1 TRINITY_DN2536_c0_g1~~TRINITY_DN2536_c0_g1_i1.p1  ORF type:complete len:204 (-),score=46.94 TRINITY_DN2536_c0_g1_i1:54-665(-)
MALRMCSLVLLAALWPVCHAFVAPQVGTPPIAGPVLGGSTSFATRAGFGTKSTEARRGTAQMAAALVVTLGLLASRLQRRTAMSATAAPPSKVSRLKQGAMLTVHKKKNNTHVALTDLKGEVIWCTGEKRYGKVLPNANRAVEAALFVAEKLGVDTIVLQLKGMPNSMGSILNTVRSTGIQVSQAYVRNNIAYGGCRPRGVRR